MPAAGEFQPNHSAAQKFARLYREAFPGKILFAHVYRVEHEEVPVARVTEVLA
jgi:hypothetical protein